MKSEDEMICKKTQLKIHKMIDNQTKNKLICIWIWVVIRNECLFNVSYQSVMILKK